MPLTCLAQTPRLDVEPGLQVYIPLTYLGVCLPNKGCSGHMTAADARTDPKAGNVAVQRSTVCGQHYLSGRMCPLFVCFGPSYHTFPVTAAATLIAAAGSYRRWWLSSGAAPMTCILKPYCSTCRAEHALLFQRTDCQRFFCTT